MKRIAGVVLVSLMVVAAAGCGKKQEALEDMQQPMSPEDLSRITMQEQVAPESKVEGAVMTPAPAASSSAAPLEKLPPAGPYEPSGKDIQTALKNAGFYSGAIDGKIGPLTTKAIEEFQKTNNLVPDGKIGPKTWAVLSKYLTPAASTVQKATTRKKR
jgi:peptidoglycan hydrolase-like protein with peptidoglycan-binding domain